MKVVIFGNMGYVGPGLITHLRRSYPHAEIVGFDIGFFASCLLPFEDDLPERKLDRQYFGDIRNFQGDILEGADVVINLAAISNDPMGTMYEDVTLEVNYKSCIALAKKAKEAGAKSFIFASSCSMYGAAGEGAKSEAAELNPLTAYARSKVFSERDLKPLADRNFKVTCLRFSAACGMAPRLRLDLVLNDFVACALTSRHITILSDGTPWRPLIHVKDMARAIDWAIGRPETLGDFLAINTGSDSWNYQIKDLANAVAEVIPGVTVSISKDVAPDKRSYLIDFGLYKKVAPDHQPQYTLITAIEDLKEGLESIRFSDSNFRESNLIRLKKLKRLQEKNLLDQNLKWQ